MKASFILFFIYLFLYKNIIIAKEKIHLGLYNQSFFSTQSYKNQDSEIQNISFYGILFHWNHFPQKSSTQKAFSFIVKINQLYLYNYLYKENLQITSIHEKQNFYIYHFNESFLGLHYNKLFLTFGYSNPNQSFFSSQAESQLKKSFLKYPIFPSLDFRIDLKRHIFILSPYYIYNKEQKIIYQWDELSYALLNHYKDNHFKKSVNSYKNYKLHYSFIHTFFQLYLNYYTIQHKNQDSNTTNFFHFNFYDYQMIFTLSKILIRLGIQHSTGNFSKGKYQYAINGYQYTIFLRFQFHYFYMISEIKISTKSQYHFYLNQWKFFGYTSIFNEYISTPQISSTYRMRTHFEPCYTEQCEGIDIKENEESFSVPSESFYMKSYVKIQNHQLMIATGYIKKYPLFFDNKNPIKESLFRDPISILETQKTQQKKVQEYLEPGFSYIQKIHNLKFLISYFIFYRKNNKNYIQISRNIHFSFLYIF